MKIYDTVIVGGGLFSYGYATSHKNTLIIESSQVVEPNFCGTLRGFNFVETPLKTPSAIKFFNYCKSLDVIKEGKLYVNALDATLSSFLTANIPNILLGSRCTEIKKDGDLYKVLFVNNEGRNCVLAKKVIVTKARNGEFLNVLIEAKNPFTKNVNLEPAFFENQFVLKIQLPINTNVNNLELQAYNYLTQILPKDAKVLQIAKFTYSKPLAPRVGDKGILYIDEAYYGNPFSAYDIGGTI